MLLGHDKLEKTFTRLVKERNLFHGYIFFGEKSVGKATFARCLANLLEFGEFGEPKESNKRVLTEAFVISSRAESESIGIDEIRDLKHFLYSKPVNSAKRVAIVDGADMLTNQAQNAILKISEEPPETGLIIMILENPDSLLQTLQSRFQKIYFGRASSGDIKNHLMKTLSLGEKEAARIASLSFGRTGRAITISSSNEWESLSKDAAKFLTGSSSNSVAIIKEIADADNKHKIRPFLTEVISQACGDSEKNHLILKSIMKRMTYLGDFNVNKRLQLEAGLIWKT